MRPKAPDLANAAVAGDAVAVVGPRGAARIRAGHPWVYRDDVARGPAHDARDGGPLVVAVVDSRGRRIARATWAVAAPIALRVLARDGESGGGVHDGAGADVEALMALVRPRLAAALDRRRSIVPERDAYRVVHAEADALPGLIVDRYADAAVVQTMSVAMNAARDAIAHAITERLGARVVIARDDGGTRDFEGLPREASVVAGSGSAVVVYRLGDNRLEADLLADGKTGGFLDQADNHAQVAALAPPGARALDAFTYHGGFALALARRGGAVLATDESPRAVERAAANARRNGLANLTVKQANAFDLVRSLESEGARFDVVVLDPPALAKRGSPPAAVDRAYKELFLRGARLTAPGGLLVACSCSGRVSRAHFDEIVADALADSGRAATIVARNGAGRDHPEQVGVPETGHLKCWILRVS